MEIDVLNQKGKPYLIPHCSRNDFPEFFKKLGHKIGAEIGVNKGEFTEKLCQAGLKIYAIDPWIGFFGQGKEQMIQSVQDGYCEETKKRLSVYPNCIIIRKTSMETVENFKDGSLDFVFIDGDHNFRHIAEDIYEWSKKVRRGGIVSGHDYWLTPTHCKTTVCHVEPIVDAYIKTFNIPNFYIVSEKKAYGGIKLYSWFFQK